MVVSGLMRFEEKKPEAELLKLAKAAEALDKARAKDMAPPAPTGPAKDVTGGQRPIAEKVKQIVAHWAEDSPNAGREKAEKDDPEKGHEGALKNKAFPEYKEGIRQDFVANSA